MRKYNDAEIARLEFLLQQATARIAFIREYHPIFIELREQAAGSISSKDLACWDSDREELEWFYGQYHEE
ncbi:MAG: hypothetical protein ABSF22_13895 [Bryobacteraceae bacterium]